MSVTWAMHAPSRWCLGNICNVVALGPCRTDRRPSFNRHDDVTACRTFVFSTLLFMGPLDLCVLRSILSITLSGGCPVAKATLRAKRYARRLFLRQDNLIFLTMANAYCLPTIAAFRRELRAAVSRAASCNRLMSGDTPVAGNEPLKTPAFMRNPHRSSCQ